MNAAKTIKLQSHSLDVWWFWGALYIALPVCCICSGRQGDIVDMKTCTQDYSIQYLSTLFNCGCKKKGNIKQFNILNVLIIYRLQ